MLQEILEFIYLKVNVKTKLGQSFLKSRNNDPVKNYILHGVFLDQPTKFNNTILQRTQKFHVKYAILNLFLNGQKL